MKPVIGSAIAGLLIGLAIRYYGGDHVAGWTMLVTMVLLPIAGIVVTLGDDWPDGGARSSHVERSPFRDLDNWADFAARAAVAGLGFSIDHNVTTVGGIGFLLLGIGGLLASVKIQRRIAGKISTRG